MRIFTAAWLLFILILSLSPLDVKRHLHSIGRLHDAGHILVFAVTGVLLLRRRTTALSNLARFGAAVLFAFTIEYLECRAYKNPFEWRDIRLDLIGLALAGLLLNMRFSARAATHQ